ncbi:hypothetical protein Afer_1904 [Acidimicrobium ferrooxidans DSM 10331]|uniref:Glycosyltransferase RgtA/B/C/D-like domain-containing protein n=1 Tax=Acidimicrobium ferrooxidans (strain DSM 10331 / JCM 15462 / NBRC 103882 / ICP) TaxID=525909 RepID=C7M1R2_ACIFD|nr:hypothetical protein [Acidimicrobium ferrooxidans]ACU54809.1 hypothetical protein Afer_1904 [Acidimicrobium ferrooxidans DSM 10331]
MSAYDTVSASSTAARIGTRQARERGSTWAQLAFAAACVVIYGAEALLLSWPGGAHLTSRVIGDGGDSPQFLWYIHWVAGWLVGAHGLFLTHQVLYPRGADLAWATLALPAAIVAGVLEHLGATPVLAYNLALLGSLVADGGAAAWCARRVGLGRGAALVAGAIYLASPFFMGQMLGHLNLVDGAGLALVVGWAFDLFDRADPALWRFGVLGALLALVVWSVYDYGIYAIAAIVVLWFVHPQLASRRLATLVAWWRGWLVLGVVAVVAVAPLLDALLLSPLAVHGGAQTPFSTPWVVDALSFFVPDPWGAFHFLAPVWHLAPNLADGSGFPGAGPWIGLVGGVAIVVRQRRHGPLAPRLERLILPLGLAMLIFALASMGPYLHVDGVLTPIPLPYLPFDAIPFVSDTLPERLAVLTALFGALLGAAVLEWVWVALGRRRHRRLLRAGLVAAVAVALWVGSAPTPFPDTALPLVPRPRGIAAVGGTTFYVPVVIPTQSAWAAGIALYPYEAAVIGTPTPEGYVSRLPAQTIARLNDSAVLGYLWSVAQPTQPDASLASRAAHELPGYLARHDVCSIVVDRSLLAQPQAAVGWLEAHLGAIWHVFAVNATWLVLVHAPGDGCRSATSRAVS